MRVLEGEPVHVYDGGLIQNFTSYSEFCESSYTSKPVMKKKKDIDIDTNDQWQMTNDQWPMTDQISFKI